MGENVKIACLGPAGSYSELAAQKMRMGCDISLCYTFAEAVERLLSGAADYAVLPVQNALNGGVLPVLDLLEKKEVFGIEEYLLPIDHRLATLEGVKTEDIDTIYSHDQALSQCGEFLRARFPRARRVAVASTAESLEKLDGHSAGIVGAHIQREGVVLSPENIADARQNFTRFLLVRRGGAEEVRSAMVFLCAVCAHEPGSLLGLLKIFQRYSLNLTRIESRPVKEAFGKYRFFIEFAGDLLGDRVKRALADARAYCSQFKLLGAYG